jgi:hypothetical protein
MACAHFNGIVCANNDKFGGAGGTMPREAEIQRTQYGITRAYRVWYLDDPPERVEAVTFFEQFGECPWLFPKMNVPEFLHALPIQEANEYLRQHPVEEQYSSLVSWGGELIRDDDLRRLEYFPELEIVRLHSDNITDAGVHHFRHLQEVEWFEFYSAQVTDACLEVLRQLPSIRLLDLQGCPRLSRRSCEALVRDLGVRESWLPWSSAESSATADGPRE